MAGITERLLVVQERKNPSVDFFIEPRYAGFQAQPETFTLEQIPAILPNERVDIILVRYLSASWQRWIHQHRAQIHRLIFFMDDDLFDLSATTGLPWHYRLKLFRMAWLKQRWLKIQQAEVWVSTPYLQQKYQHWQPRLILPAAPSDCRQPLTVFYHGSASHRHDIEWLFPVMQQVLQQDPHLSFEIIGTEKVNALYRTLPRTHVLHPMSWDAYRALLARGGRAIGLAPLLDLPFNQARSYTKFYDITQAGAVGIYADSPVYRGVVKHQQNGLLLPMEPDSWRDAILMLANNDYVRQQLLQSAELELRASVDFS